MKTLAAACTPPESLKTSTPRPNKKLRKINKDLLPVNGYNRIKII
ncbi:MAG: hypothetical protein ACJA1Z_001950 [Patiriisocius sp.]|jgi:hypothetical protein